MDCMAWCWNAVWPSSWLFLSASASLSFSRRWYLSSALFLRADASSLSRNNDSNRCATASLEHSWVLSLVKASRSLGAFCILLRNSSTLACR
uniref:Putative secreted protein n=1 Tax=Ixodes ricinus TaxID=34613 RepID=A0A6B0U1L4_IXORI